MNSIIKNWKSEERRLPGIDCIAYPDGSITILNCYNLFDPNTKEKTLFCNPLCDTTIDSLTKYNNDYWTVVDEWTSIDYNEGKIYGGDGAMGNEGFIACTDEGDNLQWGIFFENTNPIKSLKIEGNILIAINEHSELQVEINLENLTEIKMSLIGNGLNLYR